MRYLIATIMAIGLVSCSKGGRSAENAATNGSNQVGCQAFIDHFFDAIYGEITPEGALPDPTEFEKAVTRAVFRNSKINLPKKDKYLLSTALTHLYKTLTVDGLSFQNVKSKTDVLTSLTALELGDRTTEEKQRLQNSINSIILEVQSIATDSNTGCLPPGSGGSPAVPAPVGSLLANMSATLIPAVFGAWKTIAIAYQSCDVLNRPPMTAATQNVQGITITGRQSNGVGLLRTISSIGTLDQTDYYIAHFRAPNPSCFNVATTPLIYNYGGKPHVTSDGIPRLDFFTGSGSEQNTLGVDCSGFVYSAYAAAGLKMKRETALKAIDVYGISSTMLFDPENNGLTCLSPLDFGAPVELRAGDLVVERGHVVMIDHIGSDPLGIARISSAAACIPQNMTSSNFDFVIAQSSPVKGGIGINRYSASDYFGQENTTMEVGLMAYAASLCQARFGISPQYSSGSIAIIRHASDSQCIDTRVPLKNEECLATCPPTPPTP